MSDQKKLRISFNAPAILSFALLCVVVQLVSMLTKQASTNLLFSVYRSSFANPLTYVRCFTHVLGHSGWDHLMGNMMYLLILGPMLEEKYGTANMIFVILATALVTGVINLIFFPTTRLLGASGVVFAMILLSSITTTKDRSIPVTFILVALLYIGQQVYQAIFVKDNISQMAHIVGGLVGTGLGFTMNRLKMNRYE